MHKKLCCPSPDKVELLAYEIPGELRDTQLLVRSTHGAEKHGTMQSFVHKHGNKRGAWDAKRQMHTPGEGVAWSYPIPLGNMQVGVVEKTGADLTVNPAGADTGALLREAADWRGVDVVIEFSGAMPAMQAALRAVAFGGTVVAGAFPGPYPAGLDFGGEAHMNRPQIVFSRTESDPNRDHPRWDNGRVRDTVHRIILDGLIDGEPVVSPVVPFGNDLPDTYEKTVGDPASSIKMGVEY